MNFHLAMADVQFRAHIHSLVSFHYIPSFISSFHLSSPIYPTSPGPLLSLSFSFSAAFISSSSSSTSTLSSSSTRSSISYISPRASAPRHQVIYKHGEADKALAGRAGNQPSAPQTRPTSYHVTVPCAASTRDSSLILFSFSPPPLPFVLIVIMPRVASSLVLSSHSTPFLSFFSFSMPIIAHLLHSHSISEVRKRKRSGGRETEKKTKNKTGK